MPITYLFTGKGALHIQDTRTPYRSHTLCGRTVPDEVSGKLLDSLKKRFKVCKTCDRMKG